MQLIVITPEGKELQFVIDDWTPINEKRQLTEIGLICIEQKHAQMIRHALEYHFIKVDVGTDYLLILPKPRKFKHDLKKDTLILKYN